ncbi:MAG: PEP-CTERM sorting domain-containing protein [Nodularia sp. (in: Bacteria)]|nr:MAG: PEP-CTERM sorting domain-containing protein [Nodularia sp. (in: cyanobacteria)]
MANVNVLAKLSLATAGAAVVALSVAGTAQASSGFAGSYDPTNWNFNNTNANGFVNTTGAPASITITGGNNGSGQPGQTAYTTTAAASGLVSFDWSYETDDLDGSSFDPFFFLLDGVFTQISVNGLFDTQTGMFSQFVNEGNTFGFAVNTTDNALGAASATISNFHAPQAVPEPTSMIGILGLGAFGVTSLRKRKQQATVKA